MLTSDEAELYDRQIRLWGLNAQKRLRESKVLMLGFNGIASEVAKILVLAGINKLTIVDDQPLQESDSTSNLFCRSSTTEDGVETQFRTHAVKAKLKVLNPLVEVSIDNSPIVSMKSEDFKAYDLVTLHTFLTIDQINGINNTCRAQNIKFYYAIDFGFFGFMFNDLGSKFKFTYEEYSETSNKKENNNQQEVTVQSGGQKDPIRVDDVRDDEAAANDDVGYGGSSDDEDHGRPKKRRRLQSPGLQEKVDSKVQKEDDERQHKAAELEYSTFQDMISLKGASFNKKSSPILFVAIALIKFFNEHKRLPSAKNPHEISRLNEVMARIKDLKDIHESVFKRLDSDWSQNMVGSLSPVCAIVGGVAGQDMIRALSGKDIPICNTFSFDGTNMTGVVEKVGIQTAKTTTIQPVVRDCLEISDDDD